MKNRYLKLLEKATHPSTSEGERHNALSLFRAAADRHGGLATFVNGEDRESLSTRSDLVERLHRAANDALRFERERNAVILRFAQLRARVRSIAGDDDLDDPVAALYGALTADWQTLGMLVNNARRNGFQGVDNTIRKRADNLATAGVIEVRERGTGYGSRDEDSRAWRLKQ